MTEPELELFELENYIKDIWRFLPVPILYLNPLGMIIDAGEMASALFNLPKEEIIGTRLRNYFDSPEAIVSQEQESEKAGMALSREAVLKRGAPVSISILARKDEAGELIGFFVSLTDLTDIKTFQRHLEEKNKQLETFNAVAVGREIKMIALEKEVNGLLVELGREAKYG
ncbi:PAS domain-containing protein [Candidatus Saganbacteria bacterium]|nr:PAS domain-containing protein [Candidatus Saganbacteria bacterium]